MERGWQRAEAPEPKENKTTRNSRSVDQGSESTNVENDAQATSNSSMASRIGNSAASLARDVFSSKPTGANSTTAALASLAPSEKASASSSFSRTNPSNLSSTWAENGINRPRNESDITNGKHDGVGWGFRNQRQKDIETSEFASFEEGRPSDLALSAHSDSQETSLDESISWSTQFRRETEDLQYYNAFVKQKKKATGGDVAATEEMDGLAVVYMLNEPDSMADDAFIEQGRSGSNAASGKEISIDDLFSEPLSASEEEIKKQMLAALPAPPRHKSPGPGSVNNFEPNIEVLHMPLSGATMDVSMAPGQSKQTTLASHEERLDWMKQWVDEWDSVLRKYTDEVWGNAFSDVEEAKREIEEMKKNHDRFNDVQAVRRLEMILGHIRIPGFS